MNYLIHLLLFFEIYLILALSLNLVAGYCGMMTLAHASYYAIGAYTYALLSVTLGWTFIPALLLGISIAAFLSLAISLPSWRLQRDFFVLISLAVQVVIFSAIYNWFDPNSPLGSWENFTNGSLGIVRIPKPLIVGVRFAQPIEYAMLATAITVLCALLIWQLTSSPWGRALVAMRDDELALRGLGKTTRLLKVQAVAISCAFAATAGVLYAGYVSYLHPSAASLDESILMLAMVLVGGLGNFRGPFVGAAVLIALPEALRFVQLPDAQASQMRLIIYGLLLVMLVHFRPSGLAGNYRMD